MGKRGEQIWEEQKKVEGAFRINGGSYVTHHQACYMGSGYHPINFSTQPRADLKALH